MINEIEINEFYIGICDDEQKYHIIINDICRNFFEQKGIKYSCVFFNNGEEVVDFCREEKNVIDLLFLDIEMDNIDGITLKDMLMHSENVQRICFVSSHIEVIMDAFSRKTMGFIEKPIIENRVYKVLVATIDEMLCNFKLDVADLNGENVSIPIDDIRYMKAKASYTYIYANNKFGDDSKYYIISKKLGNVEKLLEGSSIIRVHKSYLVNLEYVRKISNSIELMNCDDIIPVGRAYAKSAKDKYYNFGKKRILNRI